MALFGRKKEEKKDAPAPKEEKVVTAVGGVDLSSIIKKPRVTEKAAFQSEKGVYVFEVDRNANKYQVRNAVTALFKVTPKKINIVNAKPRKERSKVRVHPRQQAGLRKAYVYLKEGDSIDLV